MKTNSRMKTVVNALTGSALTVSMAIGSVAAFKGNDAVAVGRGQGVGGSTVTCTSGSDTVPISSKQLKEYCNAGWICTKKDGNPLC